MAPTEKRISGPIKTKRVERIPENISNFCAIQPKIPQCPHSPNSDSSKIWCLKCHLAWRRKEKDLKLNSKIDLKKSKIQLTSWSGHEKVSSFLGSRDTGHYPWTPFQSKLIEIYPQFSCHLCSFQAVTLNDLDLHMVTHMGEKVQNNSKSGYLDQLWKPPPKQLQNKFKFLQSLQPPLKTWSAIQVELERPTVSKDVRSQSQLEVMRSTVIMSQSSSSSGSSNFTNDGMNLQSNDAKYDCPFCKFSTQNENCFATHFNSHSLIFSSSEEI